MKYLILLSLLLVSCDDQPEVACSSIGFRFTFFQEPKTGLCFVSAHYRMAHVPCTQEVLAEINRCR